MAQVLWVLYRDPVNGHAPRYAHDDSPAITHYPDRQSAPSPQAPLGFIPDGLVVSWACPPPDYRAHRKGEDAKAGADRWNWVGPCGLENRCGTHLRS
jgi:hypothetical protein